MFRELNCSGPRLLDLYWTTIARNVTKEWSWGWVSNELIELKCKWLKGQIVHYIPDETAWEFWDWPTPAILVCNSSNRNLSLLMALAGQGLHWPPWMMMNPLCRERRWVTSIAQWSQPCRRAGCLAELLQMYSFVRNYFREAQWKGKLGRKKIVKIDQIRFTLKIKFCKKRGNELGIYYYA